jgi:hypothetical protein
MQSLEKDESINRYILSLKYNKHVLEVTRNYKPLIFNQLIKLFFNPNIITIITGINIIMNYLNKIPIFYYLSVLTDFNLDRNNNIIIENLFGFIHNLSIFTNNLNRPIKDFSYKNLFTLNLGEQLGESSTNDPTPPAPAPIPTPTTLNLGEQLGESSTNDPTPPAPIPTPPAPAPIPTPTPTSTTKSTPTNDAISFNRFNNIFQQEQNAAQRKAENNARRKERDEATAKQKKIEELERARLERERLERERLEKERLESLRNNSSSGNENKMCAALENNTPPPIPPPPVNNTPPEPPEPLQQNKKLLTPSTSQSPVNNTPPPIPPTPVNTLSPPESIENICNPPQGLKYESESVDNICSKMSSVTKSTVLAPVDPLSALTSPPNNKK